VGGDGRKVLGLRRMIGNGGEIMTSRYMTYLVHSCLFVIICSLSIAIARYQHLLSSPTPIH
jgi:hypothetical protein